MMLRFFQRFLLVAGCILLGMYALVLAHRSVSSKAALASFDQALAEEPTSGRESPIALPLTSDEPVDFTLWSKARIRKYEESLLIENQPPLAVLSIDKLRLRVPVFEGTDELVLNRGVGRISGTAEPGQEGNIGIAGHRDGVFRGLKDIIVGDVVELTTLTEKATYVVDGIEIVGPESVEVLQPRAFPSLTLVTCFPFYFIGDAPERYIVHATLKQSVAARQVLRSSR
jgi:sortase A